MLDENQIKEILSAVQKVLDSNKNSNFVIVKQKGTKTVPFVITEEGKDSKMIFLGITAKE